VRIRSAWQKHDTIGQTFQGTPETVHNVYIYKGSSKMVDKILAVLVMIYSLL